MDASCPLLVNLTVPTAVLAVACGDSNTALSPAAPTAVVGATAAGEAVTLGVQAMGLNTALPTAVVESQGDVQPAATKARDIDTVRWNVRTSAHGEATCRLRVTLSPRAAKYNKKGNFINFCLAAFQGEARGRVGGRRLTDNLNDFGCHKFKGPPNLCTTFSINEFVRRSEGRRATVDFNLHSHPKNECSTSINAIGGLDVILFAPGLDVRERDLRLFKLSCK